MKKLNRINKNRKNKGFTLIEVIVAVSIVVILSSLAAPKVIGYIEKAKDTKALTFGKQIYTAAMWSYTNQGNKFSNTDICSSISSTTNIAVSAANVTVNDDNDVSIAFSCENKNYTIAINASANSYTISDANKQLFSVIQ